MLKQVLPVVIVVLQGTGKAVPCSILLPIMLTQSWSKNASPPVLKIMSQRIANQRRAEGARCRTLAYVNKL